MVGVRCIPPWLNALLSGKFFEPCLVHSHPSNKKTKKNLYCFDCCQSLCPNCLCRHRNHTLLQVRRYMYNDVLKLSDAEKLMDCSGVKAYVSSNMKVVFLKQRRVTKMFKNPGNFLQKKKPGYSCFTCNRNLKEPSLFCCLSCKVEHEVAIEGSFKIKVSDHRMLGFSEITPDTRLPSTGSMPTSVGSTSSTDLRTALICAATTEIVRRKRSNLTTKARFASNRPTTQSVDHHNSLKRRRKGVPNRSPLC